MTSYYNELDPTAAQWLRNLIAAGLIPDGVVDDRSIAEVKPDDLAGFTQCHFFAGIGGWPLALQLAGWPATRPVWTGSCPCQPFSIAGKGRGADDERHLWPKFRRLIAECRPPVVFGEQVASAAGRQWYAGVRADLEGLGYGSAAADLCAASAGEEAEGRVRRGDQVSIERIVVGAPHIRQRLFWMADAGCRVVQSGRGPGEASSEAGSTGGKAQERQRRRAAYSEGGSSRRVADTDGSTGGERGSIPGGRGARSDAFEGSGPGGGKRVGGLVNRFGAGLEGYAGHVADGREPRRVDPDQDRSAPQAGGAGYWSDFATVHCADGKARRFEPGIFPLADGLPARLGDADPRVRELAELAGLDAGSLRTAKEYRKAALRGYGNAIVPQVAARFVQACVDARKDTDAATALLGEPNEWP